MVRLDGSDGMINPLEIFATRTYDEASSLYDDGSVKDLKINEAASVKHILSGLSGTVSESSAKRNDESRI